MNQLADEEELLEPFNPKYQNNQSFVSGQRLKDSHGNIPTVGSMKTYLEITGKEMQMLDPTAAQKKFVERN